MVKKCKVCKGIMYNAYSDTCQFCRDAKGKYEPITKPQQSKYVFTWDEYNMLLKNKVKQGLTYKEAKRELSFENRVSNKKIEQKNMEKEDEAKKEKPKNVFKDEFTKMLAGEE